MSIRHRDGGAARSLDYGAPKYRRPLRITRRRRIDFGSNSRIAHAALIPARKGKWLIKPNSDTARAVLRRRILQRRLAVLSLESFRMAEHMARSCGEDMCCPVFTPSRFAACIYAQPLGYLPRHGAWAARFLQTSAPARRRDCALPDSAEIIASGRRAAANRRSQDGGG